MLPHSETTMKLPAWIRPRRKKDDVAPTASAQPVQASPDAASRADRLIDAGNDLEDAGRLEEAAAQYREALAVFPDYPRAHLNLGNACLAMGQRDLAESSYREAIRLQPDSGTAHFNLGRLLYLEGNAEAAIAAYREAVRLMPDFAEAHVALGCALQERGRATEAATEFRAALDLNPGHGSAHLNLGSLLYAQGEPRRALGHLRKALEDPVSRAGAHARLGRLYQETGMPEEALAHFRQAQELAPDDADGFSSCLFALQFVPDAGGERLHAEHGEFQRRYCARFALPKTYRNSPDPDRRLRVGYVSGDFRDHPVARFIEPLLEAHRRDRVEVFGYDNSPVSDEATARLRERADHWREIRNLDDGRAFELIQADAIDILVDLSGHTGHHRLALFARKPAPVQASWLGYLGTTGLRAMDYRICDGYTDPPGLTEAWHAEKLARLPHAQWCYRPPIALPAVGEPPLVRNGFPTLGSFNNPAKLNGAVLDLWAKVLKALPEARMVIAGVRNGMVEDHLLGAFQSHGIAPERLSLIGGQTLEGYFAAYAEVDLALDPFPYNGGTTTLDALLMGVPVVALAGSHSIARGGVSALSNLGLPELVAATPQDYVNIAAGLARNPASLAELRASLRARMEQSPLMDAGRFAANLEQFFREMWRLRCAGRPPQSIGPLLPDRQ
jgi:protein O-GlcNAc transferase